MLTPSSITRLLVTSLGILWVLSVPTTVLRAQVTDCGYLDQRPCQQCFYLNDDVTCNPQYCDSGLAISSNTCTLDRSAWTTKSLDASRRDSAAGCGQPGQINCWQWDDQIRDNLSMDASALTFVETANPGGTFPSSGRFIFVYRASDNKLVMRRYDRAHADNAALGACLGYANYRYQPNYRGQLYNHVRHSQLNGGWGDVWCAGELTVQDGKLLRLNNASGHYKPPVACLSYVEATFRAYGYAFHPAFQKGDFSVVSTRETTCPQSPAQPPGPDDRDEL